MIPLRTTDANLDGALVENALLFVALKIGRALAPWLRSLVRKEYKKDS